MRLSENWYRKLEEEANTWDQIQKEKANYKNTLNEALSGNRTKYPAINARWWRNKYEKELSKADIELQNVNTEVGLRNWTQKYRNLLDELHNQGLTVWGMDSRAAGKKERNALRSETKYNSNVSSLDAAKQRIKDLEKQAAAQRELKRQADAKAAFDALPEEERTRRELAIKAEDGTISPEELQKLKRLNDAKAAKKNSSVRKNYS